MSPTFEHEAAPNAHSSAPGMGRDNPLSVKTINTHLKNHIEALGEVWAEGELTAWKLSRGNFYGKLHDLHENYALDLTMWRKEALGNNFNSGDKVVLRLAPSYWAARGTISFTVQEIEHIGLGKILQEITELRQRLAAEGLSSANRKKPLPFLPNCVGLITGKNSDAERDVLVNARARWPGVEFRVIHTAVQGEHTVHEVVAALQELDRDPAVDVIIIARGGGDFMHLLPFSDETLVRAAANTATPIVSAIGHEPDNPVLDDVADMRASTPTAAGKLVVPDVTEEFTKIRTARERTFNALQNRLNTELQHLASYTSRPALRNPEAFLQQQAIEVDRWAGRALELAFRNLHDENTKLQAYRSTLRALSPLETLKRGYAVAQLPNGKVVQNSQQAPGGTLLQLQLADGKIMVISQ